MILNKICLILEARIMPVFHLDLQISPLSAVILSIGYAALRTL